MAGTPAHLRGESASAPQQDADGSEAVRSGSIGPGQGTASESARRYRPLHAYRVARQRARSNRPLDLTWRAIVLLIGTVLLLAGVALLALPGPGWATIFLAFAVLASEFSWARRALASVRARAHAARVRASDPANRRRTRWLVFGTVLAAAVAALAYWQVWGFPGPIADVISPLTR